MTFCRIVLFVEIFDVFYVTTQIKQKNLIFGTDCVERGAVSLTNRGAERAWGDLPRASGAPFLLLTEGAAICRNFRGGRWHCAGDA